MPLTDTNLQLIHNVTDRQPITARAGRYMYSVLDGTANGTAALIYCCAFNCCFRAVFLWGLCHHVACVFFLWRTSAIFQVLPHMSVNTSVCYLLCHINLQKYLSRETWSTWIQLENNIYILDTFVSDFYCLHFLTCQNTFSDFSNFPPSSFYGTREFSRVTSKPSLKFSKCLRLKFWLHLQHWCWNCLTLMY